MMCARKYSRQDAAVKKRPMLIALVLLIVSNVVTAGILVWREMGWSTSYPRDLTDATDLGYRVGYEAARLKTWPNEQFERIAQGGRLGLLKVAGEHSYWELSRGRVLVISPGLVPSEANILVSDSVP
jgi:hypothetical protein